MEFVRSGIGNLQGYRCTYRDIEEVQISFYKNLMEIVQYYRVSLSAP